MGLILEPKLHNGNDAYPLLLHYVVPNIYQRRQGGELDCHDDEGYKPSSMDGNIGKWREPMGTCLQVLQKTICRHARMGKGRRHSPLGNQDARKKFGQLHSIFQNAYQPHGVCSKQPTLPKVFYWQAATRTIQKCGEPGLAKKLHQGEGGCTQLTGSMGALQQHEGPAEKCRKTTSCKVQPLFHHPSLIPTSMMGSWCHGYLRRQRKSMKGTCERGQPARRPLAHWSRRHPPPAKGNESRKWMIPVSTKGRISAKAEGAEKPKGSAML